MFYDITVTYSCACVYMEIWVYEQGITLKLACDRINPPWEIPKRFCVFIFACQCLDFSVLFVTSSNFLIVFLSSVFGIFTISYLSKLKGKIFCAHYGLRCLTSCLYSWLFFIFKISFK